MGLRGGGGGLNYVFVNVNVAGLIQAGSFLPQGRCVMS